MASNEIIKRDQNHVTVLAGITNDSDQDITMLRVDPISKRLLISASGISSGVSSLNGLTGAVILAAGSNITLTPSGNTITIASSGGITGLGNSNNLAIWSSPTNISYNSNVYLSTYLYSNSGFATYSNSKIILDGEGDTFSFSINDNANQYAFGVNRYTLGSIDGFTFISGEDTSEGTTVEIPYGTLTINSFTGGGSGGLNGFGTFFWQTMDEGSNAFLVFDFINARNVIRYNADSANILLNEAGGFVGIGTNNPTAMLNVAGQTDINGNLKLRTVGNGLYISEGTNATMGVTTLVGGTKVVTTTKVTANSRIFLTAQSLGTITVPVGLSVSARTVGTSFTILSGNVTDTSVIGWFLVEPN